MTGETNLLCQSGEKVSVAGLYEIVGVGTISGHPEEASREFQMGEIFPDFQGRAVNWILVKRIESTEPKDKRSTGEHFSTPWQNHTDP